MKVVIAGGGAVGRHIADELSASEHEVLIIETNAHLVERVHDAHRASWLVGDACEPKTLQTAGVAAADVVVAATGDDEDNLVVSLLAKQEFAVPRVVARVNHPSNEWLFNPSWGVDVSVSTPHLLTALVTEAVSVGSLVRLLELEGGDAELVEVTLADDSPAVGRAIVDLAFPREATVVAVVRNGHVVVPRGETVLTAGDEVLVLVTGGADAEVTRILIGDETAGNAGQSNS